MAGEGSGSDGWPLYGSDGRICEKRRTIDGSPVLRFVLQTAYDRREAYTDSDKVSEDGKTYSEPCFKPDFNIDLLRCQNYICHLTVLRKSLIDKVGYLNPEYNGVQDYDYILRCVEQTEKIVHIPKVLYHWRMCPGSVAVDSENKAYTYELFLQVLREHYMRLGIKAQVRRLFPGVARTVYELTSNLLCQLLLRIKITGMTLSDA